MSYKKLKKPKFEELDQAMLSWFYKQRQNNMPVSGALIKAQAEKFADQLNITDFKASEGWLGKFKQRHHINYGKISGEARDVDKSVTDDWINKVWPKLKENYAPEDIFNADEAAIFFKLTPDKTLKFKNEKCVGGKLSKERITILVAANMSGTEKRKLMVIGKSKNPRAFKHLNMKHLPVTYKANKSAWMTAELFEEEVRKWDAELKLKGRKILLLVDNCPAHPAVSNLRNIKLAFFPPNTTSVLQPMDQSVIKSLKGHYRRQLLMELVESQGKTSINMLHAVQFLSRAWAEVTATTIQHSFRHAGLRDEVEMEPNFEPEDDLPLTEWIKQYATPQNCTENLQSYIEVDDNLATAASLTDEEILESVRKNDSEQGDEDEEDDDSEPPAPPSIQEALEATKLLGNFLLSNQFDTTLSENLNKIQKEVQLQYWNRKKHQKKITE